MNNLDSAKVAALIALRAQGKSYRQIAEQLKIDKNTVMDYVQENQEEIDEEKSLLMDALMKEYNLSLKEDLKFNAASLRKVRSQMNKIDLKKTTLRDLVYFERTRIQNINELILQSRPTVTEKRIESEMHKGIGRRTETTLRH